MAAASDWLHLDSLDGSVENDAFEYGYVYLALGYTVIHFYVIRSIIMKKVALAAFISFTALSFVNHANATAIIDQSQLLHNGSAYPQTNPIWQSFTAGISGTLTEIDMGFYAALPSGINGDNNYHDYSGTGL